MPSIRRSSPSSGGERPHGAQFRRHLAFRLQLPGAAAARLAALCPGDPAPWRRHAVEQHVSRLRGPVGRPEADAGGPAAIHSGRRSYGVDGLFAKQPAQSMTVVPSAEGDLEVSHPVVRTHPRAVAGRSTSIRSTPSASTAGPRRNRSRCSITCIATRSGRNSPVASAGPPAPWRSGTTVAPSTSH